MEKGLFNHPEKLLSLARILAYWRKLLVKFSSGFINRRLDARSKSYDVKIESASGEVQHITITETMSNAQIDAKIESA